jgi:hypothetical protein
VVGEVIFHKPLVYQPTTNDETTGTHKGVIDGKFVLTAAQQVRFQIAAYDRSKPLVIDPTLAYSTYLGGRGDDEGFGIAVDAAGNAYVTGHTASTNFPTTPGAFQTTFGGGFGDAFVSKLNAAGSALLYSTYLGGSTDDLGSGIAIDASGDAYVTGHTDSSNFPTTAGAFQTTSGGFTDAFVSKLNTVGSALLYSTYLGGSDGELGNSIAVDASGNAYVTGQTNSTNFPITAGAFQTTIGGGGLDAFVSKLNAAGSALLYSTYLGGRDVEGGNGIAVDASGNAYVTGGTLSSNFPVTPGAFQTTCPECNNHIVGDTFVSKLNPVGSALVYSTYLGGSGQDGDFGIAVDASGNAYVTGFTSSSDFPTTPGAFQTTLKGSQNAFFSKLNASGSALLYSTYLGGSSGDIGDRIAVDASGNAYVTGATASSNYPTTPGAFQTAFGGGTLDAFVSKFSFGPLAADLFLRIFPSPTPIVQGDLLTFAFPVWNLGPANADFEVLTTQVPAGTTLDYIRISGTPGLGTCTQPKFGSTAGLIVCHENSSMAPNTTWTVRVTVRVTAPAGTVIIAKATATQNTFDPNLANNIATASVTVH